MNFGYPIRIATKKHQRRKHHKKRINKKWQKKYGFYEYDMMPHGKIMLFDGILYMTERTFNELRDTMNEKID